MPICMKSSVHKGHGVGTGCSNEFEKFGAILRLSLVCLHAHHNLQISAAYPKFTEVMQIQYTPTFKLTKNKRNKKLKIYLH